MAVSDLAMKGLFDLERRLMAQIARQKLATASVELQLASIQENLRNARLVDKEPKK